MLVVGLAGIGSLSAISHDGLLAHAWVVPPSAPIDPVRVEASKFIDPAAGSRL